MHKSKAKEKIFSCANVTSQLVKQANNKEHIIYPDNGKQSGSYAPHFANNIQVAYPTNHARQRLFASNHNLIKVIKSWWEGNKMFRKHPSNIYPIDQLKEPIKDLVMLVRRLYKEWH